MPDLPPPKRRPEIALAHEASTDRGLYAELHCRTNYSFLEGASHPDELVVRAAELGYHSLAITDRNSLAGVVRAHVAARELDFPIIVGAEITPVDAPAALLLATDRQAYGRLARLITVGRRRASKGDCLLTFDDVAAHAEGLIVCVNGLLPRRYAREMSSDQPASITPSTGELPFEHPFPLRYVADDDHGRLKSAARYRELFGDRCYLLAELHRGPDDRRRLGRLRRSALALRIPLVAANDVHYHVPERQPLQDVLTAVRHGCTVNALGYRRFPNAERYLKSPAEMAALFAEWPEAIAHTREVADRCRFSLEELRYEYPEELCPAGTTPLEYLGQLAWRGAEERYPGGVSDKVRQLLEHELALIEELRYEAYFLTVWDLVAFARSKRILCQGRGSAANSVVCYCLGVTSVDPDRIEVLFERFVSKERGEAPDIDIDFEHERREEVLQYVYDKYGRERAGMTAEVITYRPRSAIRDVGKALGIPLERLDALAKTLEHFSETDRLSKRMRETGIDPAAPTIKLLRKLVGEILGFPRHLSQHVGGIVITRGPLCELVPIENASMPDRTVVEWDKDDLDALGILKVDCLALGMLTAIRKGLDLIAKHWGTRFTLATIPSEDPAVYGMIQRADTMGVFQIESRAQMSMLPRLKPECYYDLVIEVAIVRPGPIQGDMVHPYLRRRANKEPVEFPDERIRSVLKKTLGVPLFQEQAMRLAIVAAGFSSDEANQLRRAMAAWRRKGLLEEFRIKLIDGMVGNGYSAEFAERVYKQICGFGEYGFPESHAASFALLVYASAWMKHYYPGVFAAALLNSQPMGFYAPAQLVGNARQHGVEVRPVNVNHSEWDCTLEPIGSADDVSVRHWLGQCESASASNMENTGGAIGTRAGMPAMRLGFRMVKGLSEAPVGKIMRARMRGAFESLEDFIRRTRLSSALLMRLAKADAFGSLADRREALWNALPVQRTMPLFDAPLESGGVYEDPEPPAPLPAASPLSEVVADYRSTGLSLRDHPMRFLRPMLQRLRVARAIELRTLPVNRSVKVAGLVLLRQRPGTAKGITFVTMEDETGFANLIVHPETWERYHRVAQTATAMLVTGHLQRQESVIHILVTRLQDLSSLLNNLETPSRDFR